MDKMKVIIDTDLGDDIDDALALYFAMKLDFDIIGITTCFGDTEKRARIAKKLLNIYGGKYADVPVYAGVKSKVAFKTYLCQYTADLDRDDYTPDGEDAVGFIIDSCKKYGENLAILAIGPFTNIAEVIERDRDVLNSVGRFIIMGGAYFKQYADWNVMCDVISAAKMFENVSVLECIGADVTHRLPIGKENSKKLLVANSSAAAEYIASLYAAWLSDTDKVCAVLHDPLAVYYLAEPQICDTVYTKVAVVTEGVAKGITLNIDAYSKANMNDACKNITQRVKVARDVDSERMIENFMLAF